MRLAKDTRWRFAWGKGESGARREDAANHKEQIEAKKHVGLKFLEVELVLEFFISFVSSNVQEGKKNR